MRSQQELRGQVADNPNMMFAVGLEGRDPIVHDTVAYQVSHRAVLIQRVC